MARFKRVPQKIRRQAPIDGGRLGVGVCLTPDQEDEVTRLSEEFHVSKSFVRATFVGKGLGTKGAEDFRVLPKEKRG